MAGFCPDCGAPRADGAGFCGQCGRQLESAAAAAAPQPAPDRPAVDQAPPPPLSRQAPPAASPAASLALPPKRKLTSGKMIVLGLFLLGFLAVSWVWIEARHHARHPYHYYH